MRLDRLLVQRGLVSTRSKAQDLIRRGAVRVAGATVLKTGLEVPADEPLQVLETERYVARSAWKLKAALDAFGFRGRRAAFASTWALPPAASPRFFWSAAPPAFLLSMWAAISSTPRFGEPESGLAGIDRCKDAHRRHVSRPDRRHRLRCELHLAAQGPARYPSLGAAGNAWLVALIKPQFEVGRGAVGKGGIVKDEAAKERAIASVVAYIEAAGWTVRGTVRSPILGQDGNEETLVGAIRNA